jgi:PAP2 superfamily protein
MQATVSDKGDWGKIALTALLVSAALAMGLSRQFYTAALEDGFFAFALASVLIIHLRILPNWLDLGLVSAGTLSVAFVDFEILHYPWKLVAWFSFLGLASLVIMATRTIWTDERRLLLSGWVPAALFVMSDYFASTMLEWTGHAHPKTLDLYLLSFDGSLRVQLAFLVGQFYARNAWFHIISFIGYVALAIPIAVVYAGRLVRFRDRAFPSMLAFLIAGPLGIVCYNLFPACGPHSLFGQAFPFHPLGVTDLPRLALEAVPIVGARNAIPSLHLAWTLLAWWYSKGLSRMERGIALTFLVLTAFATLGTGEHWFVDLVVAFPFALMIQAICAYRVSWKNPARVTAFVLGLAGTLAWFGALRYATKLFWTSPVVPWALVAATVALVVLRQAKLNSVVDLGNPSLADSGELASSSAGRSAKIASQIPA